MKTTYIYALIDPFTLHIRYIGKANDPISRLHAHLNTNRDGVTHKTNWIKSLKKRGARPDLIIIEKVDIQVWREKEEYYIREGIELGYPLTNTLMENSKGLTSGNQTSFKLGDRVRAVVALDIPSGDVLEEHPSVSIAIAAHGGQVPLALSGERKTAYRRIWLYKTDFEKLGKRGLKKKIQEALQKKRPSSYFPKGHKPWNKGRKYECPANKGRIVSAEVREKIARALTGRFNLGSSRPVYQLDKETDKVIGEFPSICEAARQTGTCLASIQMVLAGKRKTAGKSKWAYKSQKRG